MSSHLLAPLALLGLCYPAAAQGHSHGQGTHTHTHGADTHQHAHVKKSVASVTQRAIDLVKAQRGGARPPLVYAFSDDARRTIDFFPLQMRASKGGVKMGLAPLGLRRATHALLRQVLSTEGYLHAQIIQSLEDELRHSATGGSGRRLSDDYVAQLFGRPSTKTPWGFKYEGHHLSINVTVAGDQLRATPLFLGANPAEVRSGPRGGLRVLAAQQDLARVLLTSLSDEQRKSAVKPQFTRRELMSRGSLPALASPAGISAASMNDAQKHALFDLIASYVRALHPAFASGELARIKAAGVDKLHFLWCGSTKRGAQHYYRVQGPTVFLELDAIADRANGDANHLHCLWRDPQRDFGADLLSSHLRDAHGK